MILAIKFQIFVWLVGDVCCQTRISKEWSLICLKETITMFNRESSALKQT
jgi:hypothetical protein